MKLLDTYANHCGAKIPSAPLQPYSSYFPLLTEKYITVQTGSGMPAKNYDYFNQVFTFLKDILFRNGYQVIQLGDQKDQKIDIALDIRGVSNFYQSSYIVKNAAAHIGNDSVWCHVAGEFNVPVVSLYGPTLANVCKPYYHTEDSIFLESDRKGGRATHNPDEFPKTINYIKPEDVSNAILNVLKLPKSIKLKTLKIGNRFNEQLIDIVPDFAVKGLNAPTRIRLDLCRNEDNLAKNLAVKASAIVTYEPINPQILETYKNNITHIEYEVWNWRACNVEFVKYLQKFSHTVSTKLTGEDLSKLKMRLFEFNPILEKKPEELPNKEYYIGKPFLTKRPIFSHGKMYLSEWHFKNNIEQPTLNTNWGRIINEAILDDTEYYYIYEK